MTDYHPVTKEELEWIHNDHCNSNCKKCEFVDGIFCKFEGIDELKKRILTRPDPLEALEKWRKWAVKEISLSEMWVEETLIINDLKNRPDAVIARGKEEGWWKE